MMKPGSDAEWLTDRERFVPVLNRELAALGEKDRGAVLLRVPDGRRFKVVGGIISADT